MISMNEFEKELAKRGDLVYEYLTSVSGAFHS
jgi:predicted HTH domain antitoxin